MKRGLGLLLALLALPALAVPFWGAKQSSPVGTPPSQLKPGEWIWDGNELTAGPIAVVVSLTEQRAYVYRNGLLIGVSTVSTGKKGHETPTGVFTILQKDKDHHSSLYNNAPMPYQQRLTWGGIALHAGGLPGYPESHGCVHLPTEFARQLFVATHMGMTVVISEEGKSPREVVHPGVLTPIQADSGADGIQPRLTSNEPFRWRPELAPTGPLSILLSGADRRVIVLRNGVEIGRARIDIRDPEVPLGTRVLIVKNGSIEGDNEALPGTAIPRWTAIDVPGRSDAGTTLAAGQVNRIILPKQFASLVYPLLVPGVTMLVTDGSVLPGTDSGTQQQVLDSNPPEV
ncbi:L,D-transpeptidase-like protein [Luteimonas cucumeris]|uniref:L,D-transpeptidase-like protein n=1 Tax=Luteimonas cucumeris TaxID=985012 RepID=A0A562LC03_9GAMM|nr:L,D-transpeptidase [Luteimonas cucumeris]TWI04984.1 L,D-transpeptidase-like protein [Luteimonas cucumeris]